MPEYIVALSKLAEKQLDKMNDTTAYPILDTIAKLSQNPRPHGYTHLHGRNGYRIRVGDYRIIYEVSDKILLVEVIEIGDRKNVYE